MQKRLALGLDLKGGVQFQLRVNVDEALRASAGVTRDEIVEQAKQAVDRRINELGVVEPLIVVQGPNRDELSSSSRLCGRHPRAQRAGDDRAPRMEARGCGTGIDA
jgi:preprotein translocase subunit SecD